MAAEEKVIEKLMRQKAEEESARVKDAAAEPVVASWFKNHRFNLDLGELMAEISAEEVGHVGPAVEVAAEPEEVADAAVGIVATTKVSATISEHVIITAGGRKITWREIS